MLNMINTMIQNFVDIHQESDTNEMQLLQKMTSVNCTILESGLRPREMEYYHCSCDPNKIEAICKECAKTCHKDHIISPQAYRGIQVCSCGIKAHNIDNKKYAVYKKECFYHELSIMSRTNVYYKSEGRSICLFCYNVCNENSRDQWEKQFTDNVPSCECESQNHADVRFMYSITNDIGDSRRFNFNGMNANQLINLIFKCPDSFHNIYSQFNSYHKELIAGLTNSQYVIDKKIEQTNYFSSLINFSSICSYFNYIRYPTTEIVVYFGFNLLVDLFRNYQDSENALTLLNPIVSLFNKVTMSGNTNHIPKFKVSDLENMSILQRLTLLNSKLDNEFMTAYLSIGKNNLIDFFVDNIELIIKNVKANRVTVYDVLTNIMSILSRLAAMNFFTKDQMIKLCRRISECFRVFYQIKKRIQRDEGKRKEVNQKESKLFLKILKILRIFCMTYNDQVIKNILPTKDDSKLENVQYLHTKSDLGKLVSRITISILNIITKEYPTEMDLTIELIYKEIIKRGSDILSSLTIDRDVYLVSLKKIDYNTDYYFKLLFVGMSEDEKRIVNTLDQTTDKIENSYQRFYEFSIVSREVNSIIVNAVQEFFDITNENSNNIIDLNKTKNTFSYLNIENYDLLENGQNRNKRDLSGENKGPSDKYRNILYGTRFLFTILKSIKVMNDVNDDTMDNIYKLLWFFVGHNPENAIICLTSQIFRPLIALPDKYASNNFQFFLHCFKVIASNDYELGNGIYYLKTITTYMMNLSDKYIDKCSCLYYYLKIVDYMLTVIRSNNYNLMILYANNLLWELNTTYSIFNEFFEYLIESLYDRVGSKPDNNFNNGKKFELKFDKECYMNNSLAFNIFFKFIKLLNKIYDTSKTAEKNALRKFFKLDGLIQILKNTNLHLDLRTEIIKYIRKCYIDISADEEKTLQYFQAFLENMNNTEKVKTYDPQIYFFLQNIIRRSEILKFKKDIYELLTFELKNFTTIIESHQMFPESELNYFENGIVIPCKTFLNKIFSFVDNHMTGNEFLFIYEMAIMLMDIKIQYTSRNMFQEMISARESHRDNPESARVRMRKSKTSIIENKMIAATAIELDTVFRKMKAKKFQAFNYKNVYEILNCYVFNCLQRPKSENYLNQFSQPDVKELVKCLDVLRDGPWTLKNRLNCLTIIYQLTKGNLEYCSLTNNLSEICLEEEKTYGNLLLRFLIFSVHDSQKESIISSNTILFKLLMYRTSEIQAELLNILQDQNSKEYKIDYLKSLAMILFGKLIQVFIANFNYNYIDNIFNRDYYIALSIIKILKYMCEEHNQAFQGFMINQLSFHFNNLGKNISLFEVMLFVINKIISLSKWEYSTPDKEEDMNIDYFYDMFSAIIELLIEIIQGNKRENLDQLIIEGDSGEEINEEKYLKTEDNEEKHVKHDAAQMIKELNMRESRFYCSTIRRDDRQASQNGFKCLITNMKKLLFHDGSSSDIIYQVRTQLMNFLIAVLEEKNTHESLKRFIIDSFDLGKILGSIGSTMKKYFLRDTEKKADHKGYRKKFLKTEDESKKSNRKLYRLFSFDNHIYKFYLEAYYIKTNDSEGMFPSSVEFEVSNTFYKFIKIISLLFNHETAVDIINRVNNTKEEKIIKAFKNKHHISKTKPINLINDNEGIVLDDEFLEHYYIIKFFEEITQSVEVQMPDYTLSTVIFTVMPTIKQLSDESKLEFLEFVDRENQFTKLESLIKNVNYFCEEIDYNCKRYRGRFLEFLRNLNYYRIQVFIFLLSLVANIIMLAVLEGDTQVYANHSASAHFLEELHNEVYHEHMLEKVLHHNGATELQDIPHFEERRHHINELINHSEDHWGLYYRSVTIALVILSYIFIMSWLLAKLPLYYRIAKKKYMNKYNIEDAKALTSWNKAYIVIFWAVIGKDHINSLLWMFLTGLLAITANVAGFLYSFMLLAIMNLDSTLKNIIKAIKLKYKELILTIILAFLIIWVLTNIGFFFLHEHFAATIDEVIININPLA
jgi:hypothetical protein